MFKITDLVTIYNIKSSNEKAVGDKKFCCRSCLSDISAWNINKDIAIWVTTIVIGALQTVKHYTDIVLNTQNNEVIKEISKVSLQWV